MTFEGCLYNTWSKLRCFQTIILLNTWETCKKKQGKKNKTRSLVEWMKLLYFPIAKPMK